jgi:hypothetical protein
MPRLAGLQIMLNIALAARSRSAGRYWENFFIGRAEKGHPLCRWQVLETVRKLGLEGVVGKRIDSCYEPGERSKAWPMKFMIESSPAKQRRQLHQRPRYFGRSESAKRARAIQTAAAR